MRWPWQRDPERDLIHERAEMATDSMVRCAERLELVTKRIEKLFEATAERRKGGQTSN